MTEPVLLVVSDVEAADYSAVVVARVPSFFISEYIVCTARSLCFFDTQEIMVIFPLIILTNLITGLLS